MANGETSFPKYISESQLKQMENLTTKINNDPTIDPSIKEQIQNAYTTASNEFTEFQQSQYNRAYEDMYKSIKDVGGYSYGSIEAADKRIEVLENNKDLSPGAKAAYIQTINEYKEDYNKTYDKTLKEINNDYSDYKYTKDDAEEQIQIIKGTEGLSKGEKDALIQVVKDNTEIGPPTFTPKQDAESLKAKSAADAAGHADYLNQKSYEAKSAADAAGHADYLNQKAEYESDYNKTYNKMKNDYSNYKYTEEAADEQIQIINGTEGLSKGEKDALIQFVKDNTETVAGGVTPPNVDDDDDVTTEEEINDLRKKYGSGILDAEDKVKAKAEIDARSDLTDEQKEALKKFIDEQQTEESLPLVFDSAALEARANESNGKQKYDSDQAKDLYSQIKNVINSYLGEDGSIRNASKSVYFINLNEATKVKLLPDTPEGYKEQIDKFVDTWQTNLDAARVSLGRKIEKLFNIDLDLPKEQLPGEPQKIKTNGSGGSSGGTSNTTGEITDIMAGTVVSAVALAGAIVGTVKFKEIVTLYETIGAPTGVQASLTGNYALIGIVKNNGKNYYKILDKDNNKIYYAEINDKIEINTELNKLLEINDKTMMLTTTDIGTSNFAKFADNNTLYFIQNEIQKDNITFANVLDSTDGNDYYVPLSDSSNIVSLESVINSNDSGNK